MSAFAGNVLGAPGKMDGWVYGCDACQQACPMNRGKWQPREPMPWLDDVSDLLTPEALATMDEETYRKVVFPLFNYIPEDNLARWHANAKRAVGTATERRGYKQRSVLTL